MSLLRSLGALSLAATLWLAAWPARACTAFATTTQHGSLVAKSFEWQTGAGWAVENERGRTRTPLVPGRPGWTARYASLSLTTVAPGFPVSGLNEAGLVIESLVDFSVEAELAPRPGTLTGLELVQYGLDMFSSVDELAAFAEQAGFSQLAVGLHFFACERSGRCAVIESSGREVRVTYLPRKLARALANRPLAEDRGARELGWLASWLGFAPAPASSAGRYHLAIENAGQVETSQDAFRLLDRLRSRSTQWQVVWDLEAKQVHFRGEGEAASLSLDPSLACSGAPRVLPLDALGSARFSAWTARDVVSAEQRIARQVGSSRAARALAVAVARSAGASGCAAIE